MLCKPVIEMILTSTKKPKSLRSDNIMNCYSNATLQPEPPVYRNNQDTEYERVGVIYDKLLPKSNWHILPPLSILYLLCCPDRTYDRIN